MTMLETSQHNLAFPAEGNAAYRGYEIGQGKARNAGLHRWRHRHDIPHALFGSLSPDQIDRLGSRIVTKSVKRTTILFSRGDPGSGLFAIRKGTVKIGVPSSAGHDAVFNLLGAGDVFGEIAVLDGQPRTADAVAVTDCELFVIERRDFLPLLREDPEIALKIIELLCRRLRHQSDQREDVMFLDLSSRLAKALLRLSGAERDATDLSERRVQVTQLDLANMIGMSRESTNKQLRSWEKRKWVRLDRGAIVILSPHALSSISECDDE
jgi:CRP/FNR family transcriptional regulator, cyclic AMP receptor protein